MIPYAEEAEAATLGAVLNDPGCWAEVRALVSADRFHNERNRRVFAVLDRLSEQGAPMDPASVAEEIRVTNAGVPLHYLHELSDASVTSAIVSHHCKLIREAAALRELLAAAEHTEREVRNPDGTPAEEVIGRAQTRILDISLASTVRRGGSIRELMMPVFEQLDRDEPDGGLFTGLTALDEQLVGFQPGDLIIVAGRPSMGKTALATGIALDVAIKQKRPVCFVSIEMTKEALVKRMLAFEGLIDLQRIMKNRLTNDDYVRLNSVAEILMRAPVYIEEMSDASLGEVRAVCRRNKNKIADLGLIIVDYLQLMTHKGDNRQEEVSGISRGLKAMAKELHVPVLALSQLSRAPESRSEQRPRLSDLRESGSLEQDADLVMFCFRPEYYATRKEKDAVAGQAEILIGKQRNGPTEDVEVYFRKESARFESLTHNWRDKLGAA